MTKSKLQEAEEKVASRLDEFGAEVLDDTPVALPVRFKRPQNLIDQVREVIHQEGLRAQDAGYESFEEADDFDVDDDPELKSPYEVDEEELEAYEVARNQGWIGPGKDGVDRRAPLSSRELQQLREKSAGRGEGLAGGGSGVDPNDAGGRGKGKGGGDGADVQK